jgi:hypothetical protein
MNETTPLAARDLEKILRTFLRIMEELPPDTEAGYLDEGGQLHILPDIAAKLRAARRARDLLADIGRTAGDR